MQWFIGCSGFHYKEWREVFYPKNIPQRKWFEYYCRHFNTLELNTTFYRFPQAQHLKAWYDDSPPGFIFSVKVPRLITHYKSLLDCTRLLEDFYGSVEEGLKEKTGSILFQLPSRVGFKEDILERIIESAYPGFDNVIEFRDPAWWNAKVYKKLAAHSISFCGQSHPDLPDQVIKNTPVLYYRFHGVPELYKSTYDISFLQEIKKQIMGFRKIEKGYIYFNNTMAMGGITNAKQMQLLLGQESIPFEAL